MVSYLAERLKLHSQYVQQFPKIRCKGRLSRLTGLTLEAIGCQAPIGSLCLVENHLGEWIEAEVVGFSEDKLFLMCVGETQGLAPGAQIILTGKIAKVPVSNALLGRVLDGSGKPLDQLPEIVASQYYSLYGQAMNPLNRDPIHTSLDVGVQSINSLLTIGKGQRIGLFAGSGVGKSVLLGMMTRFTEADIVVVGLIGERGREVKEFIEQNLGKEGLARSVVIASPADQSPLMRLRGAMWATSIAEYFRDQGKNVLLLMDSLTRFAQAQREIALSIGEPPATKGYPPSVFTKLPALVERAGNSVAGRGSITAFYTVLAEGDDQQDPIVDAARAILDGHIILSRTLAEMSHFPAVDIEMSISRVMPAVTEAEHQQAALLIRKLYSKYQQNKDLITIGAYQKGQDAELDIAIELYPHIMKFLEQGMNEAHAFQMSIQHLYELCQKINIPS